MIEGSWGWWTIEVRTGAIAPPDLAGVLEFTRRNRSFRPLLLCEEEGLGVAERLGVPAMELRRFLLEGPAVAPPG